MRKSNDIKITNTIREEHLDHVRNLINAFVKWHLKRHLEDIDLINKYFDPKDFKAELASLPGKYSMPEGRLLYQGFGFKNTEAYYELPEKVKNWLVFMELKL